MRKIVESLLTLQEQELVLTESRILHQGQKDADLARLETRIRAARERVLPEHLRRYDVLRRNGLGVVRESAGVCTGCHLNVPVGDLNRMRRGQMPWVCPNCARFLVLT